MKIFKEGAADRAGEVSGEELEMINALSKKELTAGEVFTFSLVLCDNEIDRDFERFEVAALEELAGLFVGRTGISDHEWASARQVARIYRTEVVRLPERVTEAGEEYVFLKAWAYMLRTEANEALIAEIEGGIKKETSVGCSVRESVCSVCGAPAGQCGHVKGQAYDGHIAHVILRGASDAYEWSFVAVPAQRGAGVTKAFGGGAESGELAELKSLAEAGRVYLAELRGEVLRLCLLGARDMYEPLAKAVESMGCAGLGQLRRALEKRVSEKLPIKTQLPGIGEVTRFDGGDEYKI
ncbi:MAG: hypothetical protein NC319_08430 [Butyricicoccus sp.]|nr:hypothetical protein [Butyricicoccus sp.]